MNTVTQEVHTVQAERIGSADACRFESHTSSARSYPAAGSRVESASPASSDFLEVVVGNNGQRFALGEVLGRGGLAEVRLACRLSDGKLVALKQVSPPFFAEKLDLLRREARVLAALDHVNIVRLIDSGNTASGLPYLAMEYLEGQALDTLLRKEGPLPLERAADICLQIAAALEHAHARGIVHNDLKPANVMVATVDGRDHVSLIDFGIASTTPERNQQEEPVFGGTPSYLSPEQRNVLPTTPRSDVYQLGLILFQCLFGKLPCTGCLETVCEESVALSQSGKAMREVLRRALAEDARQRFASMHMFREYLLKALKKPQLALALASVRDMVAGRRPEEKSGRQSLPFSIEADGRKAGRLPVDGDLEGLRLVGVARLLSAA